MSSYAQRLRTRLASCPALDVPFLALLLALLCYGLIVLFSGDIRCGNERHSLF